jgi:hypothetical protein
MVIARVKRIAIRPPLPGPFEGMSIARRGERIGLVAGRKSGADLVDIALERKATPSGECGFTTMSPGKPAVGRAHIRGVTTEIAGIRACRLGIPLARMGLVASDAITT